MVIVKEKKITLWEKLYLGAIFKGLVFTFKNFFRPKFTRSYPEEKLEIRTETKGMPVLVAKEGRTPRCVACGLCEIACPPEAIQIDPTEVEGDIERGPARFEIDMSRCIMCGFCEEACPKEAIVMSHVVELASHSRKDLIYGLDRLLVTPEQVKDRLTFIRREFERWTT